MEQSASITAHLDEETLAPVERLSAARGISADAFAADAIRRPAERTAEFDAIVQVGIDDIAAVRVVPHEEVMAERDEMIERHRRRT